MALAHQQIRLSNAARPELQTLKADALVDSDGVGPILVEVFGRRARTGTIAVGNQVLLGAIPMGSTDVLIAPRRQQLIPNPAYPNVPGALAMGFRAQHP